VDDVPLTRHPLQYSHERPRSFYFATQVRALPIVASLVRNRAFSPPPIADVRRFSQGLARRARIATRAVHARPRRVHFPDRDAVIAGDAFVTLDPYTATTGPKLVAREAGTS